MAWKPYSPYVSASALNLYRSCPCCFYLDRRNQAKRPDQSNFVFQNLIDMLMKKEFDDYRRRGEAHPAMGGLPGDLVPLAHPGIDGWRDYHQGLKVTHQPTGLTIYAVIDDVWLSREDGSLRAVDYKSHGADKTFDLTTGWGPMYQRQLELYAYALLNSGEVDMPVSSTSHLVVVKPDWKASDFGGALRFDTEVFTHECDPSWIDGELAEILACLESDVPPEPASDCKFCQYVDTRARIERGEGESR